MKEMSNMYEFDKSIDHKTGINFELDLEENTKFDVKTDEYELRIFNSDGKMFVEGNADWCTKPVEVKIFGVSQESNDTGHLDITPNYVEKGNSIEFLLVNSGEKKYGGTVIDHPPVSKFQKI